ncbi:MAG: hybrid sensor histidine kinase/response regulator, partial [Actinomycetota bacterium]
MTSTTIQDPQLERIFRAESGERLARLDRGLLDLEKFPGDRALLDDLFRETHSLKGAARMLGLTIIENTAHGMESLLNTALKAGATVGPQEMEALDAGLKKLRREVEKVLEGSTSAPPPPSRPAEPSPPAAKPLIGTVRIETDKLDDLLTLAGELGILLGRSRNRRALLARLADQWEHLERRRQDFLAALRRGDAALVQLAEADDEALDRFADLLHTVREGFQEDAARFDFALTGLQDRIRTARLLPLSTVFGLFPRMVRDLGREQGKTVELAVEGADTTLDKRLIEEIKDPLMHLLRNAVDHGIELPEERTRLGKPPAGLIRVSAVRDGSSVVLAIQDDGRGLDLDAIRRTAVERGLFDAAALDALPPAELRQMAFIPGFSTAARITELSGRGIGLDVVAATVEVLKGTVGLDSVPGRGTTVTLRLPVSLSALPLSVLRAGGRTFGLPLECLRTLRRLPRQAFYSLEGRTTVDVDGEPLLAPLLADLLEIPGPVRDPGDHVPCAVIQAEDRRIALQAEEVLDEEEVVPRPLGPPLKRVRNISGLCTLASGEICPILNPADLMRSAARVRSVPSRAEPPPTAPEARLSILLVEDSALVRAMEKRIIEVAGYEVITAVDGEDALEKLGGRPFAGVVSDI